ncbi:MAG: DNA polymerase III subunit delta [Pseudomonadota bacterium]
MVAIKAQAVDDFLKSVAPDIRAVVVYGTDPGRITERAGEAAQALKRLLGDDTELLRIEDADLETDPDRLIIELQTVPMFGAGKVIRALQGRRINGPMVKQILEGPAPASALVVEAGNLKPSDAMRKAAEGCAWAAALPCYPDTERDLENLVTDVVTAGGHTMTPDARDSLTARLGADRALSRGEVEKLLTYVGTPREITAEDVDAVVGDASALSLDRIANAAADGDARVAIATNEKAVAAGQTAQTVLLTIQRHFLALHRLRSAIETGKSVDDALRQMRPPVHFSVRDALKRQCRDWPIDALSYALQRIQTVIRETRSSMSVEQSRTERLLFELAQLARRPQRR